jgi:NTP pyrophosphatase (non-canonical NTP hydrolase)
MDLEQALEAFKEIAARQGWESLHTPKNLAMAVSNEAAELLHEFQWLGDEESLALVHDAEAKACIGAEAADVFLYLLALCDKLDIDLAEAVRQKQEFNHQRFTQTD